MLTSPKLFTVKETVYFLKNNKITSGVVKYIRHMKDDVRDAEGNLIIRSIMANEYFIDGEWYKEKDLRKSPESLIDSIK